MSLFRRRLMQTCMPYTECGYIRGDGNCWIDTGIIPTKNTKVECKYYSNKSDNFIFGARKNVSSGGLYFNAQQQYTYYAHCAPTGCKAFNSMGTHTVYIDYDNGLYMDGSLLFKNSGNNIDNYSMWLLALNQSGGKESRTSNTTKIYYFKVWEGDTLIGDFVPCIYHNENGVWDKVNNKFYGKSGSGVLYIDN